MKKLSIVIPMYNESEVFSLCVDEITNVLKDLIKKQKISNDSYMLLVDDGSKDNTWSLIEKANKENPFVHYNLACAYIKAGEIKKAKNSLIKAVTLKNDIPEVHYNLAYVYKKLGKQKLAQTYLDNFNKLTSNF